MDDNSHEPDQDRRSFLIKVMAGGSILLSLLLSALLNWLMGKIQELRRKQKQERYKASPIYPYRKGCCERVIFFGMVAGMSLNTAFKGVRARSSGW